MNVLYLCDEYPPGRIGGIGTMVQLQGREMVRQGHNVIVAGFYDWGYGGEDYFEDEGIKVYRFRRILSSKLLQKQDTLVVRAIYKFLKHTKLFEYDIKKSLYRYKDFLEQLIIKYKIEVIEMPDYCDYMRFCTSYVAFPKLSVPVIVKLHGSHVYFLKSISKEVPQVLWQMEHDLLSNAAASISVSNYTAAKYIEYFALQKNIVVIPNGVDTSVTIPQVEKKTNTVIFTGTLIEKKGIFQLAKAWNLVIEKRKDAELYIYGKGPTNKISELLTDHAKRSVHFRGHVARAEIYNKLAEAYVAVFPSYAESFGLAPIEAMLCGTATIFTRYTSGPEIINDNVDGLLTDPNDIHDIADKILQLLDNDLLNNKLAEEGKKKVIRKFDIRKTTTENVKFYSSLIK